MCPRASRATCPAGATGQVGCFVDTGSGITTPDVTVHLLNSGELYGEGYSIFDLKLAKNLQFATKRVNIGVDIYNLFNRQRGGRYRRASQSGGRADFGLQWFDRAFTRALELDPGL